MTTERVTSRWPHSSVSLEALGVTKPEQVEAVEELRRSLTADGTAETLVTYGEFGLDDLTCVRWLRARRWHLPQAAADLRKHAEWRKQMCPRGVVPEEETGPYIKWKHAFLQGCDNAGRPLTIVNVKKHKSGVPAEQTAKFVTYGLDVSIDIVDWQLNPEGKLACIFDLRGWGVMQADLTSMRVILDLLQNHYVERLGALYMYEAPTIFWAFWEVCYPFIDTVTREKIKFVYAKKGAAEQLFKAQVPADVLPVDFGGSAEWRLLSDVAKGALRRQGLAPGHAENSAKPG